jgi:hypothetical protein
MNGRVLLSAPRLPQLVSERSRCPMQARLMRQLRERVDVRGSPSALRMEKMCSARARRFAHRTKPLNSKLCSTRFVS